MTRAQAVTKLETLRSQGVECRLGTKSSFTIVKGKTVGIIIHYVYIPYSI